MSLADLEPAVLDVVGSADAFVVGAGPAGLAAAAMLGRAGRRAVVLERSAQVGQRWRERCDKLRLNSVRWMSGLPGYPIERSLGRWVGRDDYVAYLERYAERFAIEVRGETRVDRIDRDGDRGGWRLTTSVGELRAPVVVVATGWDNVPSSPAWPGADDFPGELLHASAYRRPGPFTGREVLVAGLGSSGAEIAVDLLEGGARRVSVACRTAPNIFPRQWLGFPISAAALLESGSREPGHLPPAVGDACGRLFQRIVNGPRSSYGLEPSPYGVATTRRTHARTPVIADGVIDALRDGRIELRPELVRFEGADVVLGDGSRTRPDAVIAATGYRHGLEDLVGHLGVLGASGAPVARGPETHPRAPGLHFIGYKLPHLYEIARDARAIAAAAGGAATA
ncbi:MAG TPA: NAD(P)/FAD-dependent oxidoreductase [Thermoleophilaceae bacterium]|nr:NAD(P)/FAD-dependent oxidoreductase [Thermoleophilaceae bacterium]